MTYQSNTNDIATSLRNSEITSNFHESTSYKWAIYGYSSGHFFNSIKSCIPPFRISHCADPNPTGRDLFAYHDIKHIHKSLHGLTNSFKTTNIKIDVILITCPDLTNISHQQRFLHECSTLVEVCNKNNFVKIVTIQSNTTYNIEYINELRQRFEHKFHWKTFSSLAQFPQFNDIIDDSSLITIMLNNTLVNPSSTINIHIPRPPKIPDGFQSKIHPAFNKIEFSISSFPSNCNVDYDNYRGHPYENVHNVKSRCRPTATIHRYDSEPTTSTYQGSYVYDSQYPAPPLSPDNDNIFSKLFGLIYKAEDNRLHTRPVSFFEYFSMYNMTDEITQIFTNYRKNLFLLKNSMPAKTASLFTTISNILQKITNGHFNYSTSHLPYTAPAALSNVLTNSVVNHSLPTDKTWQITVLQDNKYSKNITNDQKSCTHQHRRTENNSLCVQTTTSSVIDF